MLSFTSSTNAAESLRWKLTKLNLLTSVQHASTYQRMMNLDGSHVFDSIVFPPEIFTKLDDNELAVYEQYWKAIFLLDNHDISLDFVRSRINPLNGDTYVMKCYCNLPEEIQEQMPPLPYDLVQVTKLADIWCFGVFIFTLFSSGETLFQVNFRAGNIVGI